MKNAFHAATGLGLSLSRFMRVQGSRLSSELAVMHLSVQDLRLKGPLLNIELEDFNVRRRVTVAMPQEGGSCRGCKQQRYLSAMRLVRDPHPKLEILKF